MNFFDELKNYDKDVFEACDLELQRQRRNIELIASENIVSKAVLLAAGGVLTNKYSEGYPGKRYYGGCACDDIVTERGMRAYARPVGTDPVVVSGESGAVTAGLASLMTQDAFADVKQALKFNRDSVLLLFSTEGDTDPEAYREIVGRTGT